MKSILEAWQEIRWRPARFLAVTTAIVLAVGFLSAAQVIGATESRASLQQQFLWMNSADGIIQPRESDRKEGSAEATRLLTQDSRIQSWGATWVMPAAVEAGAKVLQVEVHVEPAPTELRWTSLEEGRHPAAAGEMLLSASAAASLGLHVGDRARCRLGRTTEFTVVGLARGRGTGSTGLAYVSHQYLEGADLLSGADPSYLFRVRPSNDIAAVVAHLKERATADHTVMSIDQTPTVRNRMTREAESSPDPTRLMLTAFGLIAILVGAMIIATTFGILLTQRQRQIGLLRAVGGTRGQVLRRLFAEAALLGFGGSVLGLIVGTTIAALVTTLWTHSIDFGLVIPPIGMVGVGLAGVFATLLAALLPLRAALRVAPLEALRPAAPTERDKPHRLRAGLCGGVVAAGIALAFLGLLRTPSDPSHLVPSLTLALGGSALISIGALIGTPVFLPTLISVCGWALKALGPVGRLAVANCTRNPRRAASTATALMLTVGLLVTLQVATRSISRTTDFRIAEKFPIDYGVVDAGPLRGRESQQTLDQSAVEHIRGVEGITEAALFDVSTKAVAVERTPGGGEASMLLARDTEDLHHFVHREVSLPPDTVTINPETASRLRVADGDDVLLSVLPIDALGPGEVVRTEGLPHVRQRVRILNGDSSLSLASSETFAALRVGTRPGLILANAPDPAKAMGAIQELERWRELQLSGAHPIGGLAQRLGVDQVLARLLFITTGLLAVAAAIAFLSVGNTVALSLLERTRELALLRALGMPSASLSWMLVAEAALLTLASAIAGVLGGLLLGAVNAAAALPLFGVTGLLFSVDWAGVALVVGIALLVSIVSSLISGVRAARISPVQAMRDTG